MVETGSLLRSCAGLYSYRGFESLSLRHKEHLVLMIIEKFIIYILKHLPKAIIKLIAGKPEVIDGFKLDPNIQIVAQIANKKILKKRQTVKDYRNDAKEFEKIAPQRCKGILIEDKEINLGDSTNKIRIYSPKVASKCMPAVLFFHQGGLVLFDHLTNDHFCSLLSRECNARVISLNYRMCPEVNFPTPIVDCLNLWHYIQKNAKNFGIDPCRVALAGDSAGGLISITLSAELRVEKVKPSVVCIAYPWVTTSMDNQESLETCAHTFPLNRETVDFFRKTVFPNEIDIEHIWANPLLREDLSNLPPMIIATAGFDPIRDQGNLFAEKVKKKGNITKHLFFKNLSHSFLMLGGISKEVDKANLKLAQELRSFI